MGLLQGPGPTRVHLDRNTAVEQRHRDNQPSFVFYTHQNALDSGQRTRFYLDPLTDSRRRPGLERES